VRLYIHVVVLLMIAPMYSASPAITVLDASQNNSDLLELSGEGVIIALADTGLDLDHTCFRENETLVGEPGIGHRKIIHINTSIDDSDNQLHTQFRHGTHVAGLLVCDPLNGNQELRSLSHNSKLLMQDIVNSDGWVPPNVTLLLEESAEFGAVINSWSWGDNTIEYTERSRMIDSWALENPWSLVFIAPGNNGNTIMEPANAINAVSVAATDSEINGSIWASSSHGPDVNGRRGIFISAPGINVNSSMADGVADSFNEGVYKMGGTSVATPLAASFTALLQEYVELNHNFTPSGPLLRSMLAMSGDPITGPAPDSVQGYGRPSLDSLSDPIFIHDSFQVGNWQDVISARGSNYKSLLENPWNGSQAVGPFLEENDSWIKYLKPSGETDVEIVMSYNARPVHYNYDDLRLIVNTSDGKFALDDNFTSEGYSQTYTPFFKSAYSHNSTNETTVMVRLPAGYVESLDWLKLEVYAKSVYNGTKPGTVGLEGDRLGFSISASGVEEFSTNTPPEIILNGGLDTNGNYTDEITIDLEIIDHEGDGGVVALRLVNDNFTIDLPDCAKTFENSTNVNCNVNFSKGLITMPINRVDWYLEIVAVDDNNSVWTDSLFSTVLIGNFTIWWSSPFDENNNLSINDEQKSPTHQNRALLWGIFGVVIGVIVAASVMFRRFENDVFESLKPPFVEEE